MKVNFQRALLLILLLPVAVTAYANDCGTVPLNYERLKAGAESGNPYCQALLGASYWRGDIVDRDLKKSLYWSRMSWEANEPLGHYNHGVFLSAKDWGLEESQEGSRAAYKKAKDSFGTAKSLTDSHYLFSLGYIVRYGTDGSDSDEAMGCELWRKAAEKGHGMASNNYGNCLLYGEGGLEKDIQEAVKYFKKASLLGVGSSMNSLGDLYFSENSLKKALKYYLQAANRRPDIYALTVGRLIENGNFPDANKAKALKLYLMASEKGVIRANYRAGLLLALGADDIEMDHVRADYLLKFAVEARDLDAKNLLESKEHWPSADTNSSK